MTAKTACLEVKTNPTALYEPGTLRALALVRRYDAGTWAGLKAQIMRARVSLKELARHLPLVELSPEDRAQLEMEAEWAPEGPAGDSGKLRFAGDMLAECPCPRLLVPEPYGLRENATCKTVPDDEGMPVARPIAFAPILLLGRLRDAVTGTESLLVAWRWPGGPWIRRIIERAEALIGRRLADLTNIGFPVADDSLKVVVGYLHRLEAANRRELPCAAVSSHLGWQGEDGAAGFLCGRTLIHADGQVETARPLDADRPDEWSEKRIAFHGLSEGDEQIVDGFHARGTLEGWLEAVAAVRDYPKALLGLYASFVPPLLQVLSVPNFIVDWSGRTSRGKTTVLYVAGSVWGNPDEKAPASVVQTWDVTRVYLERASAVLSGLPLLLDDTKRAKDPRVIAEVLYAIASGRGRGRGNPRGLARTVSWRTVGLSTGESPATSYTQDGGTRTRTMLVRGLPFGREDQEGGTLVNRLKAGVFAHYGQAGVRFVQWLLRERDRWDDWRRYYAALTAAYAERPPSPEAGRLAQYAAAIATAGVMAHRALDLPWDWDDPLERGELWEGIALEAAEADGELRALQDAVSWAYSHERTFHGRLPGDGTGGERVPAETSGRWPAGDDWEYLAFYPTVLKDALRSMGFEPEQIVTGWRERGWLDHEKGRSTKTIFRGDGQSARMVTIKRQAIEEHT